MVMRRKRLLRVLSADLLAAAALTLATLAAVSASDRPDTAAPVPVAADDQQSTGDTHPPSPGPTSPAGPAY
jgi:hypothetical protein